ncbi:glutamate--tRNA ligase [Zooshikella ganghwensis]|uniref:glutamate--tRNA ligase n=1 Tax=Zooshikella ganghwensis TaxID=202772 RepID=UPI00040D32CA|nr:glutamate--tRNA ligase [Zooshikella ganghwensis]
MTVRTRIAPSPTGDPHVGTAYIALFNYCFARQHGGQFILRIEDTDQARSTPESERMILESLRWLGLQWDEGPDVAGGAGPYRQSERMEIYGKYAEQLVADGHAFYCFATAEELDEMRQQQIERGETPKYDGRGLKLSKEEVEQRLAAGEPHVIRMKIPEEGVCQVPDMLRDPIDINWSQVDMQVLLKADGMPTYHLANVVDDHLMGITHVIRGEEWINSAPKHILLYQYFGWDMPTLCHMPLLRNPDKSKLSKRKNPTCITYYQRMGFLPEALLNYLGRMGWSMPDEREKFTLAEMIENFNISRVSLGGPIFDQEKLSWLNGQWLRELSVEDFAKRMQTWAVNTDYMMQIAPLLQTRVERLSDAASLGSFFFAGLLDVQPEQFSHKQLDEEAIKRILQFVLWRLETVRNWEKDKLFAEIKAISKAMDIKLKDFLFPLFVAVTGSPSSVSVFDAMAILGADITRARLRHAVTVLGGFSKKAGKRLEKDYQQLLTKMLEDRAVAE